MGYSPWGSRLDMIEVTKPPPPPRNLLNFPGDSVIKNLPANAGDADLVSRLERSPEGGNGNLLVFLPGKSHGQRSLEGHSP